MRSGAERVLAAIMAACAQGAGNKPRSANGSPAAQELPGTCFWSVWVFLLCLSSYAVQFYLMDRASVVVVVVGGCVPACITIPPQLGRHHLC